MRLKFGPSLTPTILKASGVNGAQVSTSELQRPMTQVRSDWSLFPPTPIVLCMSKSVRDSESQRDETNPQVRTPQRAFLHFLWKMTCHLCPFCEERRRGGSRALSHWSICAVNPANGRLPERQDISHIFLHMKGRESWPKFRWVCPGSALVKGLCGNRWAGFSWGGLTLTLAKQTFACESARGIYTLFQSGWVKYLSISQISVFIKYGNQVC